MKQEKPQERLEKVLVSPETSICDAVVVLDRGGFGMLLVVDPDRKLRGVVTDGDIRRAILHGTSFDEACLSIATQEPLTAKAGIVGEDALYLMDNGRTFPVNHLPVIDDEGKVVGLILRRDLSSPKPLPVSAVIMAGGKGTRLRPLTEDIPKPMLPVGGRPLLEVIIDQLREAGIHRVNLTTHYKADVIAKHFGDGSEFGVDIQYVEEDKPLGTAGALGLIENPDEPLLVINGDILTRVDFRAMLDFHKDHQADLTVAVRRYEFRIPYGIVETEGAKVVGASEKPTLQHFVIAGIYLLGPEARRNVPEDERYDMPELIDELIGRGRSVVCFPVREYWLDIGQVDDYQQAQSDVASGEV